MTLELNDKTRIGMELVKDIESHIGHADVEILVRVGTSGVFVKVDVHEFLDAIKLASFTDFQVRFCHVDGISVFWILS